MNRSQNYINHIALVLDRSISMTHRRDTVIQVADEQIKYLARRSQELDQETRVSVYTFGNEVECVIFDKDVLRLPSIQDLYHISGNTALRDAVLKSQDDLAQTAQMYGDHAFLTYVLTDGEENWSKASQATLVSRLNGLRDNWTVAVFVPNINGKHEAKGAGFPAGNIEVWDTTSSQGLTEVGRKIRDTTDTYMTSRATGTFRGTKALFSMGVKVLNPQAVRGAGMQQLPASKFHVLSVHDGGYIRAWVEAQGYRFNLGKAYYELTKTETIQASKAIVVRERSTGAVFTGPEARALLELPDMDVRVTPDQNPLYQVFVQSTSTNRKLLPRTELLLLV